MSTVSDVLDQVQLRLGQQKDSTGWNTQRPVVHGMLDTSVTLLSDEFRNRSRFVVNQELEPKQLGDYDQLDALTTYSLPDDCDPAYISALSALWSGVWHTVPKGITQNMRDSAYTANPTFTAWDIVECNRIELWPHPSPSYLPKVRISYTKVPTDYSDENDCIDLDFQLLVLLTLDTAIPFYGRPYAEMNNRHLNRHLGNLRAKELNGVRYVKGGQRPRLGTPDAADFVYSQIYRPAS